MRFLLLTQYFPPEIGASQVRLAALARELVHQGHEVEVVTALPNHPTGRIFYEYRGSILRTEVREGVRVHRVWLYPATGAGLKRIWNYGSFALASLLGLCRARRPDVVFVESPPLLLSVPGWFASLAWRAQLVFNVADLWPDSVREMGLMTDGPLLRLAGVLERWSYRRAAFVNAATEGIREALLDKKGVPKRKVLFLPNGVDLDLFRPAPPDDALACELGVAGKRVIVYAGTIGYAHRLDVALEAMALLGDLADVVLVLAGAGSEAIRLAALASERKLGNVRFLGPLPVEKVARLYTLAAAGLSTLGNLPFFAGTRPAKLFPIMASGKAVLYSGAGEGAKIVQSASAGLVVPPADPAALASAIRALVDDPARGAEMGRCGRAFVERNFGWPAIVSDWLQQLDRAQASSR